MIVREKSYRSKDKFAKQNPISSPITLQQFQKMNTFVKHYPLMSKEPFYGIILNKKQLIVYSHNALILLETPNHAVGYAGELDNFNGGRICFGNIADMIPPRTAMMLLEYYGKTRG